MRVYSSTAVNMFVFFVILTLSASFITASTASPPSCDLSENPIDNEEEQTSFASAIAEAFSSSSSSSSAYASASATSYSKKPGKPKNKTCIYDECTPTCSIPNPPNCPQTSTSTTNRCNCDSGYILSEKGGQCVKLEECQKYKNCKGDRNSSYTECPSPCASTCSKPNAESACEEKCEAFGCQCDPLYVLSNEGQCISPNDCPGGNPCGQNKTFIYCNAKCPTNYCPTNDNRGIIACDPPYPCPSGCSCLPNYKYLSEKNETCILASECPPVECTRQNEIWNSCPPACFKEKCSDLNKPEEECVLSYFECQPQCVCKDGYRRNDMDNCVPIDECNETCVFDDCTPTCLTPNASDCPQTAASSTKRCKCDSGYILSEKGGQCVKLKDCEQYTNCKGNASFVNCPSPCASTCSNPNAGSCNEKCEPYGCQCNALYVLSNEGQCISPNDCPGGNPCGQNKTFVYCNAKCPTNNCPVNDNRGIIACSPPYPCSSGCACLPNYKYLNDKSDTCVLASECPPVECTRENEVWNSCTPACFSERCSDLNKTKEECYTYVPTCQPQCVCKDGYRRNDSDICVPIANCTTVQ